MLDLPNGYFLKSTQFL